MSDKLYETICNQHTDFELWLEEHDKGIGANGAAGIMGESPFTSPLKEFRILTGLQEHDNIGDRENVKWGLRLEMPIALGWAEETNKIVVQDGNLLRSKENPFMQCTPDCFLPSEDTTVQIKNYSAHAAKFWEEGIPKYIWIGEQHTMAIMGTPYTYVACLLGGNQLVWDKVERDDEFIKELIEAEKKLMGHVERMEPPEAIHSDVALVAEIHPKENESEILLGAEIEDLHLELQKVKEAEKDMYKAKKEIENRIKLAIGDNAKGKLPNGGAYSWKTQHRKESVTKASSFRVLRYSKKG